MPERILQVVRTYTTWWQTWLMMGVVALLTALSGYLPLHEDNQNAGPPGMASLFALGLPVLIGFAWLVAMAKWQFSHSRARLIPGYRAPHLAVLATALTLPLVINPVCLSMTGGQISPAGAVAFTLLLGGVSCWSISAINQFFGLLTLAIFFSAMTETGAHFWFAPQGRYAAIHGVLLVVGAVLMVGWLWRLTRLHEEMDDYQIGVPGIGWSLSRWERAQRGRIIGRQAARAGVIAVLAKRAVLLWLALQVALVVTALSLGTLPWEELGRTAATYTLLSLALQVPAFAWCLWLAKRQSLLLYYLGIWLSGLLQVSVVSLWWWTRQVSGDAVFSLLAVAIALSGWLLICRVRQSWRNMELR